VSETSASRPNIVFIFCDDLGYGDLGSYGSTANRTPRLDRMAQEGLRLTDFYVSAAICTPSRASLMTGCYSQRVGLPRGDHCGVLLPGDSMGLNPDEITVAEILKGQGYATKMIGKWHLGDQPEFLPTRHGFDHYFGLPYSNDMTPDHPYRERIFFPPLPLLREEKIVEVNPDQSTLTARYTDEAVAFIRERRDGPFFLYFPHMYVHQPLYPPDGFRRRSSSDYAAEVECLDWSTGRILDTLQELGIAENTLVVFTSDNGALCRDGGSNAPLRGSKGTTWEGGLREPCLVWWPGTVPAGSVSAEVCTVMDFLPTLAGLAGARAPDDRIIDGKDITPILRREEGAASPHEAFCYYNGYRLEAVRADRWKLHVQQNMLVDLAADVGETTDVLADHPDVAERLQTLAEACRDDLGDGEPNVWGPDHPAPRQTRPGRTRPCGTVNDPVALTAR